MYLLVLNTAKKEVEGRKQDVLRCFMIQKKTLKNLV